MRRSFATIALLAGVALLALPPADAAAAGQGRLHRERLEVGRALIEAQSSNWQSILPYYTADIEYHDPVVDIYGIDMMAQFLGRLFASSGDLVTTVEDETLSGEVYSASWTMAGQFNGVPYNAKGISIVKFRDRSAQVYYQRDYYSENDIMVNIPGLDQAAIGFRTYYRCAVDPTFVCPLEGGAAQESADAAQAADKRRGGVLPDARLRRERLEIGRALIEINGADWQSLLPYYTDDIEYHDPIVDIRGIDTMVPFLARLFASSGDLITTVEDEALVGGTYTATWTMSGQFDGIPYSAKGMSILKFRPGTAQAYYSRDYYTEGDVMATIPGLDQAIGGFRTYYRCAVDPTYDCPLDAAATAAGTGSARGKSGTPRPAAGFSLGQNAPNPFNPSTGISFVVPEGGATVSLRIYDLTGRLVRTLVDGSEPAGMRTVTWTGTDDRGRPVPSGAYFYELAAPSFSERKKMVLLK